MCRTVVTGLGWWHLEVAEKRKGLNSTSHTTAIQTLMPSCGKVQNMELCVVVVAYSFNPSTPEAEAGRSLGV